MGLIISNDLSWKRYLYGEEWRSDKKENFIGLLPKLSKRLGLLKMIRNKMSSKTFELISNGLFTSLLIYCIQVFGNVWGLESLDETNRRYSSFGKEDCRKLQVLQNKVLKLQTGLGFDFPTNELLKRTNSLSIHQLIAFHTLVQMHKIINNERPKYLAEKLQLKISNGEIIFPHRHSYKINVKSDLSISRAAFVYRGARIFNQLPLELRLSQDSKSFKSKAKKWVSNHISIRPP